MNDSFTTAARAATGPAGPTGPPKPLGAPAGPRPLRPETRAGGPGTTAPVPAEAS